MKLSHSVSGRSRPAQAAARPVTRKDFTDRLGLPENASNAQVLATIDTKLAAKPLAQVSAEDEAMYRAAFGG